MSWIVVLNGKPSGPYTAEQLKELKIGPSTFVRTDGMDDYKEAQESPELRALLGFEKITTAPQYFATLDVRLIAVTIDYLLIFSVCLVCAFIAVMVNDGKILRIMISVTAVVAIPLIKIVYATILEASDRQATFGKQWLGLKVCDEAGNPITFRTSLGRNLAKILSALSLGIGYLIGFFNRQQQCLHDRMAGTLVVRGRLL
jgi:uncharacterized RDD family membrane protein YckC